MAKRKSGAKSPKPVSIAARKPPRKKRNPLSFVSSPKSAALDFLNDSEIGSLVLPGVAGYGVTRLVGRIVRRVVDKKWPGKGKHANVVSSIVTFLLVMWSSNKWATLKKRREGLLVGSGVAAVQSLIQSWLPGLSWLFDAEPAQLAPPKPATSTPMAGVEARRRRNRFVSPGQVEMEENEAGARFVDPGTPVREEEFNPETHVADEAGFGDDADGLGDLGDEDFGSLSP